MELDRCEGWAGLPHIARFLWLHNPSHGMQSATKKKIYPKLEIKLGLVASEIAPSNNFFWSSRQPPFFHLGNSRPGNWWMTAFRARNFRPGDTQSLAKVVAEVTAVAPHCDPNLQIFKQTLDIPSGNLTIAIENPPILKFGFYHLFLWAMFHN